MLKSLVQFIGSPLVTSYSVSLGVNALVVLGLFLFGTHGLSKRQVEVAVLYGEFAIESQASAGQTASETETVKLPTETPPDPTLEPTTEPRERASRREAPAPLDGDQPSGGEASTVDKPTPVVMLPPPSASREAHPVKSVSPPRSAIASRPPGGRVGSSSPIINLSNNRPPIWPPALRHIEGSVLLELFVSPEGNVNRVVVLQSSGHALFDAAAVNAAQTWQAEPAIINGTAVETIVTQEVIFRFKRG